MKLLYTILGSISLALGIIGIFLPVLPTTPFLLLTATLYFRSSPKLYAWLIHHKKLGPYIQSFRENKALTLKTKMISIGLTWLTILYCVLFILSGPWLKTLLLLIASGVTIYILSFKTLKEKIKQKQEKEI